MEKLFKLNTFETDIKTEIYAGFITFLAISYVLFVHPSILAEAGVPVGASTISTILISVVGSLAMGFYANSPLAVAPAMGINTLFAYTLVGSFHLSWQQALGVIILAGAIFALITLLGVMEKIGNAIPHEMIISVTIGIGFFLVLIGLQNSGFIIDGGLAWSWIGLFGIIVLFLLNRFNIKGAFLISIILSTILFWVLNPATQIESTSAITQFSEFGDLITAVDFSGVFTIPSIIGTFSLVMILIFEALGMTKAFTTTDEQVSKSYKVAGVVGLLSGLFGTSTAIPVAENGAGVQEGGKTGLTAVTVAVFFLVSLVFTSLFAYIPAVAIGPVIIFTGLSMFSAIKGIHLENKMFWIPALLVIVLIPLTGSIVDGMAYGFIAYPIIALITGEKEELNGVMWTISILFLLMLVSNRLFLA